MLLSCVLMLLLLLLLVLPLLLLLLVLPYTAAVAAAVLCCAVLLSCDINSHKGCGHYTSRATAAAAMIAVPTAISFC
jgi:hypothetical protein